MLFNSFIFLIFLGVVLPIFYLLPNKRSKNIFLLISSYFFYGYWDWKFCSLLAISTIVDFYLGQKLFHEDREKQRKIYLTMSMVVNLGLLGIFKYFNFFVDSFSTLTSNFGYDLDFLHLNIILPVGISFYTFQTMSYTIDIYKREMEPTNSFIDFALFVSFFPQLVAGPIERASNLLPQLNHKLKPNKEQIQKGIILIVTGLFKKVMIGDTTGRYVDQLFGNPELYKSPELLAGLILFSIQIYADFSGYSNIARGTAKLLGVELMKNFEQPYLSRNITEFWRRWHISLSSWLKDYLYISLGGNRKGKVRTYINLFATMLLGGLWHGAAWTFVIWGGLHGAYLAIHKAIIGKKKISISYKYTGLVSLLNFSMKCLFTNIIVLFTWLFFRVKSLSEAKYFLSKMINWESSELTGIFVRITLTFVLVNFLIDFFEYKTRKHTPILLIPNYGFQYGVLSVLFGVTLLYMFQSTPLPFVYFQF